MDAWRAACKSTVQSRLLIPAGRFLVSSMFFAGPCLTPRPITIQVVGTVLATTDISEYENGEWLMFDDIAGLKLIGGGTFDGQGKDSWAQTENCETASSSCVRAPSVSSYPYLYFTTYTCTLKIYNILILNILIIKYTFDPYVMFIFNLIPIYQKKKKSFQSLHL